MSLISVSKILDHARKEKYAVGAFLCMNLEMISATIDAAEKQNSPVIVRIPPDVRRKTQFKTMVAIIQNLAAQTVVPVGISLDHGASIEDAMDAIAAGFSSVMVDFAKETLEENIRKTKQVTVIAKPLGILTETSVGSMPYGQTQHMEDLASVEESKRLISETGAEILAPAVGNVHGTAHGESKAEPHLEVGLIKTLLKECKVHHCLHGGSSIPEDQMKAAIAAGINQIIIYSDICGAFDNELRRVLGTSAESIDLLSALVPAQVAVSRVIQGKMQVFGSAGQAFTSLHCTQYLG